MTVRPRRSWEGPAPQFDIAVKRIHCSDRRHVEAVRKELDILWAAEDWRHCVGGRNAFWAPWRGKGGARRGTTYFLGMQCALRLLCSTAAPPCLLHVAMLAADVDVVTSVATSFR